MRTVESPDGAQIAFECGGEGPPLVLVHGVAGDRRTTWRTVRPHLERRFAVCALDRRGRGDSGDGEAHSLAREAADVAAVAEAVGPAHLLGHSYGATVALETASLVDDLKSLTLYGPRTAAPADEPEIASVESLLDDPEAALVAFLQEVAGLPDETVADLRDAPGWTRRVAAAEAIPRELRALRDYEFYPRRYEVDAPTLVVAGEETPAGERRSAEAVADALGGQLTVLDGQGRTAMHDAPGEFAAVVASFALDERQS